MKTVVHNENTGCLDVTESGRDLHYLLRKVYNEQCLEACEKPDDGRGVMCIVPTWETIGRIQTIGGYLHGKSAVPVPVTPLPMDNLWAISFPTALIQASKGAPLPRSVYEAQERIQDLTESCPSLGLRTAPGELLVPDVLPDSFADLERVLMVSQAMGPPAPLAVLDCEEPGLKEDTVLAGDVEMTGPKEAAAASSDPAPDLASRYDDLSAVMAEMERSIAALQLSALDDAQVTQKDLDDDHAALKALVLKTVHFHDRNQQLETAALWQSILAANSPDVPDHLLKRSRGLPSAIQEGVLAAVVSGPLPSEPCIENVNAWNQSRKMKSWDSYREWILIQGDVPRSMPGSGGSSEPVPVPLAEPGVAMGEDHLSESGLSEGTVDVDMEGSGLEAGYSLLERERRRQEVIFEKIRERVRQGRILAHRHTLAGKLQKMSDVFTNPNLRGFLDYFWTGRTTPYNSHLEGDKLAKPVIAMACEVVHNPIFGTI